MDCKNEFIVSNFRQFFSHEGIREFILLLLNVFNGNGKWQNVT